MAEWTRIVVLVGAYFQLLAIRGPFRMMLLYPSYFLPMLIVGILWIVVTIYTFKAAAIMKEDLKKGSKRALIFGLVGFNIITIIGAICGLIKSSLRRNSSLNLY